ncbi:MAG: hypothetical protein AAF471_06225 [Myxococcota bacterium]
MMTEQNRQPPRWVPIYEEPMGVTLPDNPDEAPPKPFPADASDPGTGWSSRGFT